MRNYKMLLSYDGTAFQGWQRLGQKERTIQATLETALEELTGEKCEVIGSGRTDAGVHARGQVANVKMHTQLPKEFAQQLNQILSHDLQVLQFTPAAEGFHSRHQATGKVYRYYVDTNERPNVFRRKYVYHFPRKLDLDAMREAANFLHGRHDFTSFTDEKSERSKVRDVRGIQIHACEGKLEFVYEGDGFLYHMVRILTGTLLEVGTGQKKAQEIPKIFAAKERSKAGFMVPAKGLFLDKVYYS